MSAGARQACRAGQKNARRVGARRAGCSLYAKDSQRHHSATPAFGAAPRKLGCPQALRVTVYSILQDNWGIVHVTSDAPAGRGNLYLLQVEQINVRRSRPSVSAAQFSRET